MNKHGYKLKTQYSDRYTGEQILKIAYKHEYKHNEETEALLCIGPLDRLAIKCLLANNRRFIKALYTHIKANNPKAFGWGGLQNSLINDLTSNNGKLFWAICSDFIGENNEQ